MNRRAIVTDYAWPDLDHERAVLAPLGVNLVDAREADEAGLVELASDPSVVAILTCWKPVTAKVLGAATACVTVARYGVGLDNIDIPAATDLGMIVSNVPDYCVDELGDHTMALVLALARNVVPYADQIRSGGWDNSAPGPMHRLRGRTLGLVGFGRSARAVAARAAGFGLDVLAYSRSLGVGPRDGAEGVGSLDELLARADIVSLHVPLSTETESMIDAARLARMKPGALLINTARGRLVDLDALSEAIAAGTLAGAALDVLPDEPPPADHPLRTQPGVLITPHAAFDSVESRAELLERTATNVVTVLGGSVPDTIVNREVLGLPQLRLVRHPASPASS